MLVLKKLSKKSEAYISGFGNTTLFSSEYPTYNTCIIAYEPSDWWNTKTYSSSAQLIRYLNLNKNNQCKNKN